MIRVANLTYEILGSLSRPNRAFSAKNHDFFTFSCFSPKCFALIEMTLKMESLRNLLYPRYLVFDLTPSESKVTALTGRIGSQKKPVRFRHFAVVSHF